MALIPHPHWQYHLFGSSFEIESGKRKFSIQGLFEKGEVGGMSDDLGSRNIRVIFTAENSTLINQALLKIFVQSTPDDTSTKRKNVIDLFFQLTETAIPRGEDKISPDAGQDLIRIFNNWSTK